MDTKILILKLITAHKLNLSPSLLRGFIANKFKHIPIIHQHENNNKFIYSYPLIQYKLIDGYPMILGINEGTNVLYEIYKELEILKLSKMILQILEKKIIEKACKFETINKFNHYKFITPYLPLNQQNYKKYIKINLKQKHLMLNRILTGNILSIAKSLSYVVIDKIKIKSKLYPLKTKLKSISFIGFKGEFEANFALPDYIGLGKSVSRGFGTIIKIR